MSDTPNEDRVRAMELPRSLVENMSRPGRVGVVARIVGAYSEAQVLAIAREMDRGSDPADILVAVSFAAGASVAAVIVGQTIERPYERGRLLHAATLDFTRSLVLNTLSPPEETLAGGVDAVPRAGA